MRLLPHSLFGRNLLFIAGLIVAVQLTTVLAFYQSTQKPRIVELASFTANHLHVLKTALSGLTPAQRGPYIAQLNRGRKMRIEPIGTASTGFAPPVNPMVATFMDELKKHLGESADIRWKNEPEPQIWIRLELPDATYWLSASGERFVGQLSPVWLAVTLLYGGFALLCAYLIQRRLNRPLRELAAAAAQIGAGGLQHPLNEDAPSEIAAVSRSFNAMSANLGRLDAERAVMLAGVSHDLRTPLTKLQLGIAMLKPGQDEDLKSGMIRHIDEINSVIEQFVDFARTGSDEPMSRCDPNEMIGALAGEFADQGFEFALELEVLPELHLRPVAMHRLIANLMRNAVRYGGAGLAVRTSVAARAIRISILDRGPGIPFQQIDRLKQPFTRMDEARSKGSGSGLGLAIVDRIAHLHGGQFLLLPREGGGLEAAVVLPR